MRLERHADALVRCLLDEIEPDSENRVLVKRSAMLVVALVGIGVWSAPDARVGLADDATPPAVTVAPEQTVSPTLALPTADPTALPTVVSEGPSPEKTEIATVVEATEVPSVVPTAVATEAPASSTAIPTSTPGTSTTGPTSPATPITLPWPSPDQLKQDARLRWGSGVPTSVRRWAFLIVPAAKRYNLDPNLIAAVMTMESNGDPLAESPAGAIGLMQILNGPWDPRANVAIGARMLSSLYAQFGAWNLALAAYNAGPGAVEAAGGIPPYRETRDYVIVVQYLWDLFGHHRLSVARRKLYRHTLGDLARFKDQRKKVVKLARIAHITDLTLDTCSSGVCAGSTEQVLTRTLDPFWPVDTSPDPLQQVGPIQPTGSGTSPQ